RHRTRERIWVEENARLVRDEAGRPLYYEGTVKEITDRKAAEAELWRARLAAEDANRAKSAFLATMSHELRTPLNAIIGFAEVMLRAFYGPIGEPRYVSYLEDIRGSGLLLLQLLDDILDLSKVEAGKIELAEEPVDLAQVVVDCLRMLASRARAGGVTLEPLRVAPDLPLLRGDERRLRQVVLNLLSNAVKYNRPDGSVQVSLAPPGQAAADGAGLVLVVCDTGPGIPEAELERVFDPFVQLERSGEGREGVGLGLPLARQLVQLHEGTIRLTSGPGQGTTAEVRFPAARCLPAEGPARCEARG
ncbi:MAG: ATP-binding protein, partial [Tistlia sp.]